MMKNKKLMVIVLALAMAATMFTGCSGGTPSSSEVSSSESSSVVETPAETIKATGVVKEMSMSELVVTLEDGSEVTLKVEDLEGINDIALGDTIEVEYTEDEGVAVATSVKAAAKVEDYAESENAADEQTSAPDAQNPTSSTPEAQTPASNAPATSQPAASQPAAQAQAPAAGNTIKKNASGMTDKARAEAVFATGELDIEDWDTPAIQLTAGLSTYSYVDANHNILAFELVPASVSSLKENGYGHYQSVRIGFTKAFNDYRGLDTEYVLDGDWYIYDASTDTFSKTSAPSFDDSGVSNPSNQGSSSIKNEVAAEGSADVIDMANKYRSSEGLAELIVDDSLMELAVIRAEECVSNFGHERPDGSNVTVLGCAEIITRRDSASEAIDAWKNSSAHNKIMLSSRYSKIGAGHAGDCWVIVLSE